MKQEIIEKIKELLTNHTHRDISGDFIGTDALQMEKVKNILLSETLNAKDVFLPKSEANSVSYKKSGYIIHEDIMLLLNEYMHHYCYNCANKIPKAYTFCPFCNFRQE